LSTAVAALLTIPLIVDDKTSFSLQSIRRFDLLPLCSAFALRLRLRGLIFAADPPRAPCALSRNVMHSRIDCRFRTNYLDTLCRCSVGRPSSIGFPRPSGA
jgi:hypothetical protein